MPAARWRACSRNWQAKSARPARLATTDIRDRAGWTAKGTAFPKQAALLAEAALPHPETPTKDVVSEGTCLVLGRSDVALPAAGRLSDTLAITCLLTDTPDDIAPTGAFDLALGHLKSAQGALGGFAIEVDAFRELAPGGRGAGSLGRAGLGGQILLRHHPRPQGRHAPLPRPA